MIIVGSAEVFSKTLNMNSLNLNGYENQLEQIKSAIKTCKNEDDLENLKSLEKDLIELINLSFLQSLDEETDENIEQTENIENSVQNFVSSLCKR